VVRVCDVRKSRGVVVLWHHRCRVVRGFVVDLHVVSWVPKRGGSVCLVYVASCREKLICHLLEGCVLFSSRIRWFCELREVFLSFCCGTHADIFRVSLVRCRVSNREQ
jgi:hypothetical protein